MAVKLVFLGRLADLASASEEKVAAPLDWTALLESLDSAIREWAIGDKVKLAVNGIVLTDKTALKAHDGDEVALLPPVSGG